MQKILLAFYKLCRVAFEKGVDTPKFWAWVVEELNSMYMEFSEGPEDRNGRFITSLSNALEKELLRRFGKEDGEIEPYYDYVFSFSVGLCGLTPNDDFETWKYIHDVACAIGNHSPFSVDLCLAILNAFEYANTEKITA